MHCTDLLSSLLISFFFFFKTHLLSTNSTVKPFTAISNTASFQQRVKPSCQEAFLTCLMMRNSCHLVGFRHQNDFVSVGKDGSLCFHIWFFWRHHAQSPGWKWCVCLTHPSPPPSSTFTLSCPSYYINLLWASNNAADRFTLESVSVSYMHTLKC